MGLHYWAGLIGRRFLPKAPLPCKNDLVMLDAAIAKEVAS